MGVFDFVRNGVREMMVARPDQLKNLIVYKHPDQNIPMYSQLTVDSDECAVFFKDGGVQGILPGGQRYTLHSQNIPFLNNLITSYTGGQVFIAEVFFVKTAPVRGLTFGGMCGDVVDPMLGEQVTVRMYGQYALCVTDPALFITRFYGQAAGGNDNNATMDWISKKFFNSASTVITALCEQEQKSILDVLNNRDGLAQAFMQKAPGLVDIGVRITEIGEVNPSLPEEDRQRLVQARGEIAQKKRDIMKRKMEIEGAQADAQARQFELDQKFQQDARYVQQLAGNYQNYAAGQAMIGAGQGMAAHGMGDGMAGAGAQMAVGMGMGNMMAQSFQAGGQPHPQSTQQPAQPNFPGAPAAAGGTVSCAKCGTKQPGGRFCAECGSPLSAAKKFCTGCGGELAAGAKFCANCGTAATAAAG
jgi:membrane protease subunit (stomatin/prohibitin family)